MSIDIDTVTTFTRQNTGSHMLDSGGTYGRIWQSPAPVGRFTVARDGTVALTLTGLLAEHATVVSEVQETLEAALEADEDLTWFEAGPLVMERLGFQHVTRNNTCNSENDLDQNFVYEVWVPEAQTGCLSSPDWLYNDDAVVLVYAHTGCDVRGGYARPIAVRFDGEYALPVDLMISFHAASDETEEWMERYGIREDYFSQWSGSDPQYALSQAVGGFVAHDPEHQTLTFENPHYEEGSDEPETLRFVYEHWV